MSTPVVLPADGALAATNTRIWITPPAEDYFWDDEPVQAEELALTADASDVEFDTSRIAAFADVETHLWILQPVEPLPAGAVVEVWMRGERISSFEVTGDPETKSPPSPAVSSVEVAGEYFGYFFCGELSAIRVEVEEEVPLLFLTRDGQKFELAGDVAAVGTGTALQALNVEPGEKNLQIFAVDLAGNRSEPTSLPELHVPPQVSGCSASGGGTHCWGLLVLVAAAAHVRRRRSA